MTYVPVFQLQPSTSIVSDLEILGYGFRWKIVSVLLYNYVFSSIDSKIFIKKKKFYKCTTDNQVKSAFTTKKYMLLDEIDSNFSLFEL